MQDEDEKVSITDGEVIKNVPGSTWKARGQTEERKGRGRTIRRDCLGNWRPPLKVIPDLSTRGEWLPDQLSVISRGRYEEAHFCCPNCDARWPVIFTLLRATENKRRKTMMTTGRTCFFHISEQPRRTALPRLQSSISHRACVNRGLESSGQTSVEFWPSSLFTFCSVALEGCG